MAQLPGHCYGPVEGVMAQLLRCYVPVEGVMAQLRCCGPVKVWSS